MNTKNLQFKIKFEKELEFYKHNDLTEYNIFYTKEILLKESLLDIKNNFNCPIKEILFTIINFIQFHKNEDEFIYLINEFKKFSTYKEIQNLIVFINIFNSNKNILKLEKYFFDLISFLITKKSIINTKKKYLKIHKLLKIYFLLFFNYDISKNKDIKKHIYFLLINCFDYIKGKDSINKFKFSGQDMYYESLHISLVYKLLYSNFFRNKITHNITDSIISKFIMLLNNSDKNGFITFLNKFVEF